MKILFFNDPMGTYFGDNAEQEADYCKETLQEWVFGKKKFDFESTFNSLDLENKRYDMLIFDFGGIGIGAGGLVSSLSRQILKLIEDRPDTLFIAWTHFTNEFLKDECSKELGEYPNLINREDSIEVTVKAIKKWIRMAK